MRLLAFVIVLLGCSGCSLLASKDRAKADFDFGPPGARASLAKQSSEVDIVVYEISAPAWMDNSSMYYRLAYQNATRPIPYAQSEWVMSPAALLTERLRLRLSDLSVGELRRASAGDAPSYTLRSELFQFEQVFDQPDRSRGVLRLRATLEGRGVRAQRTFVVEKSTPTADAAGGVSALSECADELASSIIDWLAMSRADPPRAVQTNAPARQFSNARMPR
jgi:cholesterol transport system auxiliary component